MEKYILSQLTLQLILLIRERKMIERLYGAGTMINILDIVRKNVITIFRRNPYRFPKSTRNWGEYF